MLGGIIVAAPATPVLASPAMEPVIGAPVALPRQPLPGGRFAVRFAVTRSDTRAPLIRGKLNAAPSVDGRVLPHSESLAGGVARLSLLVPVTAQGKTLVIRLTITSAGSSATRTARFSIRALAKPTITVGDASIAEGNEGSPSLNFPVTLSAATPLPVTVRYTTSDGLATAGTDYTPRAGVLTLKPGQRAVTLAVAVVADSDVESDETFTVTLSNAVNATVRDGTGIGTIVNEDVPARSGHYTGSTSLWTFIAFDVSEGAKSVSGLFFFIDLTCDTPLSILRGVKIELLGPVPVRPNGSFEAAFNGPTPANLNITLNVSATGTLSAPGSARGSLRVIDVTSNEPPFRGAHCRTDEVAWNAVQGP
jgi:hypothetical protein